MNRNTKKYTQPMLFAPPVPQQRTGKRPYRKRGEPLPTERCCSGCSKTKTIDHFRYRNGFHGHTCYDCARQTGNTRHRSRPIVERSLHDQARYDARNERLREAYRDPARQIRQRALMFHHAGKVRFGAALDPALTTELLAELLLEGRGCAYCGDKPKEGGPAFGLDHAVPVNAGGGTRWTTLRSAASRATAPSTTARLQSTAPG